MKQRVLLKGKDGLDLLHRISTIDLKQRKLLPKTQGLILNPQGKIRAAFSITILDDETAEIEFEDAFLEALDQYTFGERYEITKLPSAVSETSSERDRILALLPKPGAEFKSNEETNPLEVNLRSAIHDQKGCYPGQEVVEKIISLGSPAKKLCLLEGILSDVTCPVPLTSSQGTDAGTLTSYSDGFGLGIIKRTFLKENEVLFMGTQKLILRKISEI